MTGYVDAEDLPRSFGSPSYAVEWAHQRLGSSQHYARSKIPAQPRSPWDRISLRVDPQDLDDLALTITGVLAMLPHGPRAVLSAMLGDDWTRGQWLMDALNWIAGGVAEPLWAGLDSGGRKAMAQVALERSHHEIDQKRKQPPKRRYAAILDIDDRRLTEPPYRTMIETLEEAVRYYRDQGLGEVEIRLESVGIIR